MVDSPQAPRAEQAPDNREPEVARPGHQEICALLEAAEVVECKALPWGSNYTFALALAVAEGQHVLTIYKPRRGEIPLWDFPDGTLYRRERAAYLTSLALGWEFIPPTVIRDGPHGIGSAQLYIEPEPRLSFERLYAEHEPALQRIAVFDCLTNNADRKAGHFLLGRQDGRVWGIDHGLTFNSAPKLRTVIWEYCEQAIPDHLLAPLRALGQAPERLKALCDELEPLLLPAELEAFLKRLYRLLDERHFPSPNSRRSYPWPPF
jgi:hypothetical protein